MAKTLSAERAGSGERREGQPHTRLVTGQLKGRGRDGVAAAWGSEPPPTPAAKLSCECEREGTRGCLSRTHKRGITSEGVLAGSGGRRTGEEFQEKGRTRIGWLSSHATAWPANEKRGNLQRALADAVGALFAVFIVSYPLNFKMTPSADYYLIRGKLEMINSYRGHAVGRARREENKRGTVST